jgi:hypothetical protein
MNHQERQLSYLLRMWQEGGESAPGDTPGEQPLWRASLESPHTHRVQAFASLDELFAFLREAVDAEPPQCGAAAGEALIQRGGSEMKKVLVAIVVVAVLVAGIAVGSALLTSGTAEPIAAEGSFAYEITAGSSTGSGEMVLISGRDKGTWEGAFEGTSIGEYAETGSPSGRSYEGTESFKGYVEDEKGRRRHGTLEIQLGGERGDRESEWQGTWEIIAGEGDLENLAGGGTWTGPPHEMVVYYSGQLHFESKPFWRFW